ncbi:MAG TPA: plastocyanin/azurin family copper-binding protein [Gemmatimonadaceae bacterium]|nr:plastocyanin/azurin family copper-binding protein [Gemmatimonadaceae bacterium]
MKIHRLLLTAGICATAALAACAGGEKKGDDDHEGQEAAESGTATSTTDAAAASFSATQLTPESGRKVVTVQLETDAQGNNKFTPNNFEVHQGDVIRYTLVSGVHNVHFLPDSNPNAKGLPASPSDMLQLPNQTIDLKVTWGPGHYYFQCDPHALLGMMAHVEVED